MIYILFFAAGFAAGMLAVVLLVAYARGGGRKKREFGKIVLGGYAVACILFIEQNYILAFLNRTDVNANVTVSLITTIVAALLGYYAKSLLEKASRNKHKVDENGRPFGIKKGN